MEIYFKAVAGTLIALIMFMMLSKQSKDMSVLLSVAVCCMLAVAAMRYFEPVIDFINRLQQISKLKSDTLMIILRSVGIALLTEIAVLICADAGNIALGKSLQLLSCVVVLWISIPLFTQLLELIEDILLII